MANPSIVKFIREARARGFDDFQIREPLLKAGWPKQIIEEGFAAATPQVKHKNKVCIYLDSEVLKRIEKRAKKNLLTAEEQICDILRRSSLGIKPSAPKSKCDDFLVSVFSRERKGRRK